MARKKRIEKYAEWSDKKGIELIYRAQSHDRSLKCNISRMNHAEAMKYLRGDLLIPFHIPGRRLLQLRPSVRFRFNYASARET